jgi:hypothetical protein
MMRQLTDLLLTPINLAAAATSAWAGIIAA